MISIIGFFSGGNIGVGPTLTLMGGFSNTIANFAYGSAINAAAAHAIDQPEILAALQVGMAVMILQRSQLAGDWSIDLELLESGAEAHFMTVSEEWLSIVEQDLLSIAKEMKATKSRLGEIMSHLAAGYMSVQRRREYKSKTSVALINGARVGAMMARNLDFTGAEPLAQILPEALEFGRSAQKMSGAFE